MILIIKSTHSLSTILTDRSSGWWATPSVTIQSISILTHSLSEWSEHNSYTVMTMNTIDSKEKESWCRTLFWSYRSTLSLIILNTVKWFQYSIPHYSICLTHPSHTLSCYEGQVAIRFNPYESLSSQHSSLLSSLWLWDIIILFHYPLTNPYTWILNNVW